MASLRTITRLADTLFAEKWHKLHGRGAFSDPRLKYPGIYLLAFRRAALEGRGIVESDVLYVGMSNSSGGVAQRLKQFRDGIEKNGFHSGAMRFYRDHSNGSPFSAVKSNKKFYFVALTLPCVSVKARAQPTDFQTMGHVAALEYYVVARVLERTGRTPPLNHYGTQPA